MRIYLLIFLPALVILPVHAQKVYDFRLDTPEGQSMSYSEIKGSELTVIDFWATWCKPCVNSIPKLVELANSYDLKRVAFIAVSIDSPRNLSKIRPFAESVGINYPVLLDTDQELLRDLNVTVIPTLIVVNAADEVVYTHEGFVPGDEKQLEEEINRLLGH